MSEITKMMAAVGLLAAGFYSASLFGSPKAHQAGAGSARDRSPQRLEPLENAAALPPSAAATWDENVALATHVDGDGAALGGGQHEVARPAWPDQNLSPLPGTNLAIPEIRRQAASTFNQADVRRTTWPEQPGMTDDRLASLAPPPLLSGETVSPMRASRFPDRPLDAAPPSSTFAAGNDAVPAGGPEPFREWRAPELQPIGQPNALRSATGEPIWHVVADGDSLPRLAERYLRDANRAREIYDLNRDVLTSPDVLPIGAELRIPQNVASSRGFEVFNASGDRSATYKPQSRLVPLPELPASVRAVPRARLQRPVSASLAGE